MKLKELTPLIGTDEVIVLIPQDTVASESVLANYLEDEGGLERIDTASELGILLRPYQDRIIANLTPESVSYDYRGLGCSRTKKHAPQCLKWKLKAF